MNPVPATPVPPLPAGRRPWLVTVAAECVVGLWLLGVVVLALIIWVDVETVLATGPILLVLGLGLASLGACLRYRGAMCLGLANAAITVLLFVLTVCLDWGPYQARLPFIVMGAAFLAATLWPTIRTWRHRPPVIRLWECQRCHYPLVGLRDPRCPECGLPFDVAQVNAAMPLELKEALPK